MSTRLKLSLVFAFGVGATACSHAATLEIANPLKGGAIGNNTIEYPDPQSESEFELPSGTLTQRASMTKLDDKEVCFDLALAALGERRDLAKPQGWKVFLRGGDPEFEDMKPEFREIKDPAERVEMGSVVKQASATERICDDRGNCYNKEIVTTYREPAPITIVSGGGTVCFSNQGKIQNVTEQVTLHLDDPKPDFAQNGWFAALVQRVAFRWKFN
jgi:hypothetical protein